MVPEVRRLLDPKTLSSDDSLRIQCGWCDCFSVFLHESAFICVHQRLKLWSSRRSLFRYLWRLPMEISRRFICLVLGLAFHFARSRYFRTVPYINSVFRIGRLTAGDLIAMVCIQRNRDNRTCHGASRASMHHLMRWGNRCCCEKSPIPDVLPGNGICKKKLTRAVNISERAAVL